MRVGLASLRIAPGALEANLSAVEQVLEEHCSDGLDLVVFSEANLTGFPAGPDDTGAPLPRDTVLEKVNEVTRRTAASICVGFAERAGTATYLTHALSSEGVTCGTQRKLLASNPTKPSALSSGGSISPIPFRGYCVTILACADWTLPEPPLMAAQHEPDIVLAPTDEFHWTSQNRSSLGKAGQATAFWLQAPLLATFGSLTGPGDPEAQVFAALAFDGHGDQTILESRSSSEEAFHVTEVVLGDRRQIWGGFAARRDYLAAASTG